MLKGWKKHSYGIFKIKNTTFFDGISNIDSALDQMSYILTLDEKKELKELKQSEKEKFIKKVWSKRDPVAQTKVNELMEEYYGRVWYANENFDAWAPGWETDMGMIYILFGPPDEIQRSNPNASNPAMYQVWHYYRLSKQFVFKDQNGFGDYRLDSPFIGEGY